MAKSDLVGSDTLPLEGDVAMIRTAGPPVAAWDRYELLELLGKGGMGWVYKARDRRLDRIIAIKFLLSADPNLTMRFMREARAQARIDHPHICRIYEVGEVEGRAYIALQYIAGEPLPTAAGRMSVDEKIAAMRDVAVAIQEAHRLGIVHRDLKPGNVMVERTDDGRWFPIVMDFGLARETTTEIGLTASGQLLGTPAYMSPEQARGDIHAVDRRSDVYSLGATLYELLTGRPPFPHGPLALALEQVIHDQPPAPRSLVPSLQVDLETVALKCLTKDPAGRYPSARALADDLDRYLRGEPILGRRPSLWQRLRLRARRHRGMMALGAWSLAIIAVVAALGLRACVQSRTERVRATERAELAERLGRDARDLELYLRSAYQLPLHDTQPDRERIRARMRAIAATRHDLGALGDGVVHEAVGRGHLALHQWREAADELARAAASGRQTPELHAALGSALGELYRSSLDLARRSDDKAWFARRKQELERQYLTPALAELALSRPSGDDAALLEARIALYRGEFAPVEKLAQATVQAPLLFEARRLAADGAYELAVNVLDRGDYDAASTGFERAASLYAEAIEIARSDPSAYEAAAQTWLQHAESEFRRGREPRRALEQALDAIDRALRAAPDSASAHTTRAYVLLRWYRTPSLRGPDDPRPLLEQIAQAAQRAVELDPDDAHAWDALGNAHTFRGIYEANTGGDGAPWWNRALDEVGRALALQPNDVWANNDIGAAHRWLGAGLDETGQDPMPEYQAALRSFERAAAIDPQFLNAWTNQTDIHTSVADHDGANGVDPGPAAERARLAGERGLAIDPNYYSLLGTMAQAQLAVANYVVESGGDPGEALTRALGYLDRAAAVQPGNMATWFYRVVAAEADAKRRLRDGVDPSSAIAVGRAAVNQALQLAPAAAVCHVEAARLDLLDAAWAARRGPVSIALLASARAEAEKAIAINKRSADAMLVAAQACLQIATAQHARAVVERGIEYLDGALALNPRLRGARAVRDRLLQLRAR